MTYPFWVCAYEHRQLFGDVQSKILDKKVIFFGYLGSLLRKSKNSETDTKNVRGNTNKNASSRKKDQGQ